MDAPRPPLAVAWAVDEFFSASPRPEHARVVGAPFERVAQAARLPGAPVPTGEGGLLVAGSVEDLDAALRDAKLAPRAPVRLAVANRWSAAGLRREEGGRVPSRAFDALCARHGLRALPPLGLEAPRAAAWGLAGRVARAAGRPRWDDRAALGARQAFVARSGVAARFSSWVILRSEAPG